MYGSVPSLSNRIKRCNIYPQQAVTSHMICLQHVQNQIVCLPSLYSVHILNLKNSMAPLTPFTAVTTIDTHAPPVQNEDTHNVTNHLLVCI